ncbi:MAG: outer membrane homotrimeric porin [Mailhella sp.]|nr:outer membrane homotrimeric porin [Mailhella sp.]
MKKLATLLLAAGMVVASTAPANAVDVKVSGEYRHSFSTGSDFSGANLEDMRHRMRLNLALAASENLSAFVQFQLNHAKQYGTSGKHGDGTITTRQLYLDWVVPTTAIKVRMGRQSLGLPEEAFGSNSILGAGYGNREGIVVTAPVNDWLGLTGIWARLGTDGDTDLDTNNTDDIYAVAANLKFEGVSGAVYAAYATLDDLADGNDQWNAGRPAGAGDAYWLGFTSTFSFFDPFTLKLSAAYGEFNADDNGKNEQGWNVQVKGSYALPFGTAVLGGWYFSGEDKDGKGYMPNAGYFNGTNHYYDGNLSLATSDVGYTQNTGTWAVQAGIEDVSFLEDLTHSFHVTYMEGTNDKKNAGKMADEDYAFVNYLTEEDSAVEFTLNSVYKIYKNLAAHLELAYIINEFDNETAKDQGWTEDNWYASLTFQYKF